MAEGESVKLFVGQVPKHMTEAQLLAVFKELALVDEVKIIRDKATRVSRGCCFVICRSREEADKAVDACHDKMMLPGASRLMQVKYADGELERLGTYNFHSHMTLLYLLVHPSNMIVHILITLTLPKLPMLFMSYFINDCSFHLFLAFKQKCQEHKLFVGMLPKSVSDAEVSGLFSEYGTIKDLQILRGSVQTTKGCAFLKFETKEQALAAIEALNGKHKMEGSSIPLVVKWADTEKERQDRKVRKALLEASTLQTASRQHQSIYGALPMSYVPSYNGYGYQTPGTFGFVRYRLPQLQNQHAFPNMIPPINHVSAIRGAIPDRSSGIAPSNYAATPANYIGSAYPVTHGIHYSRTYPGGIMRNQQLGFSSGSLSPSTSSNQSIAASGVGTIYEVHTEGPPGANLFIFHIPQQYGDAELANLFQRFGRVLSAKVFVDRATGVSKCFGFVSYDSAVAAQNAINAMNGFQLGGKKLKVQLKRENKQKHLELEVSDEES